VTDRTAPSVVTTGIGWWRPEASAPEFAALDININAALTYAGPMDPMSGSVDTRAVPCRLQISKPRVQRRNRLRKKTEFPALSGVSREAPAKAQLAGCPGRDRT
jgi:hypothetical protein